MQVFLSYSGENAHHVAAWKYDLQMLKSQKQKEQKRRLNLFLFFFLNTVSFSHPAVGGRKEEKRGSQSWFGSIYVSDLSSQGDCAPLEIDAPSDGSQSLLGRRVLLHVCIT